MSAEELPVITDAGELLEWFVDRGAMVSPEELETATVRVGRNGAPPLVADLWTEDVVDGSALAAVIGDVWSMAEYPDRYLGHDTWRELFAAAGYTVDGVPAQRPAEALTLYRGSVPERRADWSWTDARTVAARYADGQHYRRPKSAVWTATVEPWRLLARNDGRQESEYVVDTEGMVIRAAE